MSDTFRFPNGYDVHICRKREVIATIDENIIDKDVALLIVKQCELDAANFLREGRWAGLPFMGNIRVPKSKQILNSVETKELIEDARETLDKDKYVLFRKNLTIDIGKRIKAERYYKYIAAKFISKNARFFNRTSKKYGDYYARILCYTLADINIVSSTWQNLD